MLDQYMGFTSFYTGRLCSCLGLVFACQKDYGVVRNGARPCAEAVNMARWVV